MGIFDFFKGKPSKKQDFIDKYGDTPIRLYIKDMLKHQGDALFKIAEANLNYYHTHETFFNRNEEAYKDIFIQELKSENLNINDLELKISKFELIKNIYAKCVRNHNKCEEYTGFGDAMQLDSAKLVIRGAKLALKEISLNPIGKQQKIK